LQRCILFPRSPHPYCCFFPTRNAGKVVFFGGNGPNNWGFGFPIGLICFFPPGGRWEGTNPPGLPWVSVVFQCWISFHFFILNPDHRPPVFGPNNFFSKGAGGLLFPPFFQKKNRVLGIKPKKNLFLTGRGTVPTSRPFLGGRENEKILPGKNGGGAPNGGENLSRGHGIFWDSFSPRKPVVTKRGGGPVDAPNTRLGANSPRPLPPGKQLAPRAACGLLMGHKGKKWDLQPPQHNSQNLA